MVKAAFARALPGGEPVSPSRAARGERGIWQRRYWEHTLRDETDFRRHLDYTHFNPVKHGHTTRVREWPHSSFHRWVRLDCYPEDWAGDAADPIRPLGDAMRPVGWVERSETHCFDTFGGAAMGFAALNPSYAVSEPLMN